MASAIGNLFNPPEPPKLQASAPAPAPAQPSETDAAARARRAARKRRKEATDVSSLILAPLGKSNTAIGDSGQPGQSATLG